MRAPYLCFFFALAAVGCRDEPSDRATMPAAAAAAKGEPISIALQTVDIPDARPVVRAMVDIGKVELVPAEGGAPKLVSESAGAHDLVLMTSAVPIAKGEVPPGCYSRMALYLRSAAVTLDPAKQFENGKLTRMVVDRGGPPVRVEIGLGAAGEGASACQDGVSLGADANLNLSFDYARSFKVEEDKGDATKVMNVRFSPTFTAKLGPKPGELPPAAPLEPGKI